jgi:hypothetical protein
MYANSISFHFASLHFISVSFHFFSFHFISFHFFQLREKPKSERKPRLKNLLLPSLSVRSCCFAILSLRIWPPCWLVLSLLSRYRSITLVILQKLCILGVVFFGTHASIAFFLVVFPPFRLLMQS